MDREVIHVLPQEFIVDDEAGIQNPVGMAGVRLEAKIHIVTGAVASAHNLVKCANRSGLDVSDIVLESLASGEAVLTDEEKQLGTALLDLGGGTTDLAVFSGKNIKHTFVLALGGNNLTNDIAVGLRAPQAEAEKIKKKYGTCLARDISSDETIEVPGLGGTRTPQTSAADSWRDSGTPYGRNFRVNPTGNFPGRNGKYNSFRICLNRRNRAAGGGDGSGRIDFQFTHPPGQTPGNQRTGGCGQQPYVCNRRGAGFIRCT